MTGDGTGRDRDDERGLEETGFDYDVVVVGGGPTGCSAAVFTARNGLDTLVFDRGTSSLGRCAHLENYLGFPAGVGIQRFYDLMHDHVTEAGAALVAEMVASVRRPTVDAADEGGSDADDIPSGFVVETQAGRGVTARRVVAATRYDGEYLRDIGEESAMFAVHDHDGEEHERFDLDYANADGTTPVQDLYVASPAKGPDRQAIVAAGHGARVGLTVVEADRVERGIPESVATLYDWVRRESERSGEWTERETWREFFDDRLPDDHADDDRYVELREAEIDRRLDQYVSADEMDRLDARAQDRLLDHVDDERILERARELDADRPDVSTDE